MDALIARGGMEGMGLDMALLDGLNPGRRSAGRITISGTGARRRRFNEAPARAAGRTGERS
jgi:hypothetical protein